VSPEAVPATPPDAAKGAFGRLGRADRWRTDACSVRSMRMNLPAGAGSTRAQVSRHLSVTITSPTGMGSIAVPR